MISVIRKDGNDPFPEFSSCEAAIRYKIERELDKDWVLSFEPGYFADYREQMFAAAMIIHDELRPKLRQANYDKLIAGKIPHLYGDVCEGYGPIAALYGAKMLNMAGHSGWTAVEGHYETKDGSVRHGWLEHANGAILDIACGHLYRLPVMAIDPLDEESKAKYKVATRIEPTRDRLQRMKPGDGMIELLQAIPLFDWMHEPSNANPIYAQPVHIEELKRDEAQELEIG